MNSSEDEPLSGLNSRLRPRRRTTSFQSKNTKKCESRTAQDKPKRTRTPSRALPNKPEDLTNNADSFPVPQHLCPHCDRKFSSKQTVSKHARRIHLSDSKQDFFIACLFCNHTEAEANEIIRHMVDNHPNQYFACLDCQTRFSSTSELAEHKLNVCEKQKPYRSKLRQKNTSVSKHTQKNLNIDGRDDIQNDKEYIENRGFNGIVISCELKPSQIHDEADIEDNITTNLILPPSNSLANSTVIEKNAVIVLDDIQWNKRIPPNFSFHNTDADQILSRLGVVHRSPRTGETTRRDWFKTIDDSTQKFEKCFETSFYSKVASNVAENLAKCLDGSFNFNPDLENTIKTRRAKNSVVINTAEGFPILLAREQFSRNLFDSYMPRSIAPKHKWKWDSPESDKSVINADQVKRDSHTNNCIITLVSSLDIWTQLSMRKKFENKFNICHAVKKTEKQSIIDKELKEILESREIPTTSSTQIIKYTNSPPPVRDGLDFPSYLGLAPSAPSYDLQPAVLSGEWVRPRCYVCCACGAQTRDSRALSSHISIQHPNAQVQHYEIVGEPLLNADILKHLYVPPSQVSNRTRPLRGIRDCTKCQKSITLEDLHQHMLDCAGDTPAVRRKCRYRPFGVRRRRPRLPDNVMRRKIRKDLRNRHKQKNHLRSRQKIRSEVGDAETIRKMIADLPAKRHRVVVNPLNPTLRPRRKLDKQRSTLLMKHRSTDDSKSRKLRSVKDLNNSANSVNIPPHKEEENKVIPNQDDVDNKPLKPTRRPTDGKNTRHSDSIKRKTVLNRAKRKILMKNISIVKLPDLDTVDANSSSNSPDEEFQKTNGPKKIDVNNSQYSSRQHSGRGNYNRSSNNRDRNHRGNNDRGNYDRGNSNRGSHDRGNNNRESGNQGNGNLGNNNRGQGAGGNQDKVENDPLAENDPSKATLTAEGDTEKSKDQQERYNCPQHLPTRQAEFENEAADSRIDKPPLLCNQKVAIDPQKNISTKTRKGKGLHDCIEMLKMKNNKETAVDTGNDSPIDLSAHGRAPSEVDLDFQPAVDTDVYETSGLADLKALQSIQQDSQQVSQTSFQTHDRHLAQPATGSAIQTHTRTVIEPTDKIEASPVVETEVCLAVKTKALPVVQDDNRQAVHTEDHLAIHKGDPPYVHKDDHLEVHTDNGRGVAAGDRLATFTTAKPKARSFQPDMRRAVQPDARTAPHPTLQSEAQLFAHHIANLAANSGQRSVEHPLAPDARALALYAAEHLGLQSAPHLAAHQSVHPVRHPIHPAMFSAIRPEFELAHFASLAGQAQLAAQYRGVNPMDSRFFRPFDPSPLERGLAYLQRNIAHDQAAHGLPLCTENQTQPSTPPKKTPVRRKSTRLTSRSNVPPDLPQNIFGLTPLEMIPPQQFPGPYSSMMISPDSDQTKKRKQNDIANESLINQPDFSKSPKTAEFLHAYNMSGGQLIENKSYQQPVDTEPSTRSTVESRILENQRKIAERLSEIRTNSEQTAPLEYRPHPQHVTPDALMQAEQRFRVPSYPYPTYSDHINYAEHRPSPENRTLHEKSQYPGMKSHVDKNMQQEPRPHPDSRTYTQQLPFQNQMPFPELRPLPRSLEQMAFEQRFLNQRLFPDQPLCPNIAIRQDLGKYPEQRQNSQQTSYPNQALFPDNRTTAEKVVDQKVQNEVMLPPEHRPLTKRRLSKELKSVSERNLSTDQRASNERRPSNDLLSIQEQNTFKEQNVTKDISLSVEQTPIEPRLPAKLRLSAERKLSDERRLSNERKLSDERRLSNERKLSDERRLSNERKLSDERRLSNERKLSDERRLSNEPKLSDEQRLSAEQKPSVEHRSFLEPGPSVEHHPFIEHCRSIESQLSVEPESSSVDSRATVVRAPSVESQPSVDRLPTVEHQFSTDQKPAVESRPSAGSPPSASSAPSAGSPPSAGSWPSAVWAPALESRPSREHRVSIEQNPSVERRPTLEHQFSTDEKPVVERRLSVGNRPFVVRAPSVESRPSIDSRPSVVRTPSVENRHSIERAPSAESRMSSDRRPSFERDLLCERRLSKELRHVHEHTVTGNEMLCEGNTPSSQQGILNKQWPAINQQLLHEQILQAQHAQLLQEHAQLLQSVGGQRLLNEQMSLNERRLSEHRSSTEQKSLNEQELMIQNNALREEETLVQPTYTGLNPHMYIQNPLTNAYHSNHGLPHNAQNQAYMTKEDSIPLDLSSQRPTDTPIPHAGTRWQHSTDSTVERNLETELSFSKGVSWNSSSENKAKNTTYGVRVIPSKNLTELAPQECPNLMNEASRNLTCRHFQEFSNTVNDASRIPAETLPQEYSNTMNDPSRILAEREPIFFSNIMTNTSHSPPDFLGKSTLNSNFVDKDISDNISNTADFTADDESFLDIMSTEDIKPEYGDSIDIKTELTTSESRIIDNAENIQQLNSNVLLSNIMTARNPTLEAAISANSDICATAKQSAFATSSLNSESDAIRSLPVYTLSNPVMATTVNKHESTLPVHTSVNACVSVKEIDSSNSGTLINSLHSIAGSNNTTSVYTAGDRRIGAPFNYGGIQNNDLQMGPAMRNSHMQTTAFEDTTAADKVDASTAINETPDPETARKIALLPPELVDVLGGLPTEKRNMLLNVLPQYVSTSKSSPRKHYDSNNLNTSHQTSTSEHMLVHESQNMTNLQGFIPNYQLPTNMQHCPAQFMGSFNMDKNHPMSYLPSAYQAPPPPPPPQFTMLPPPPPPPPILVAPPPPPPVKEETSQNNPPLPTQSTFIPPLPPNPPPPLFPLPAVIKTDKTDDEDEDVKPPIMDMKEEKDLENEDLSVDKFQPGPSAAPENRNTNNENTVIDLTEETPLNYKDFIELADDDTKTTVIPPQQFNNYHVALVTTPNLKTISDKTSSLRAVRIKTASERNKSSTVNVSQSPPNTEPEVSAVSARPSLHKEIQQCIKTLNEREIEIVRDLSEQTEHHVGNTAVEKRPIIDQFQDSEEEDNKLLQWKISLAIQQAEITSTQQNNKNKASSSKPTATVSPGSILRPENLTNNELLNPVAPTEDILIKNDKDLIDNSVLESRTVNPSDPQQDSHVLDRSQNSAPSQNHELIDGAQLPSKDNIEPKNCDKTASRVERLTTHMTVSDSQFTLSVKQDNTLEDDDSDDDVSLAIIVKNRDQLKNNLQIDNSSGNKSANNKTLEDNIKEDTVLKETTNNLNKDRTVEPNSYINDKIEIKQLQQQQIIQKASAGDITKEILQTNKTIKETEYQPTKTNNRKKSFGDPNDHELIEIQTVRNANKEEVHKSRNIISDSLIEKETSNSAEQLINKPYVMYDKRDQQTSSLKKIVKDGIKKSPVSLKPNDKEMPEIQKDEQKNNSTCNLSTTSLNGDDLTTHTNSEIAITSISLKTVYQKPKEILAQTSVTESHPSQNTKIIATETSAVDETDNLKEIADKSINRVVIENNRKSLGFETDENNITPLRRSRRKKSALGEDDIIDEPGASVEQKTPLTKKQLIFSKLLLDEENHAEPQAHSTPEKDLNLVEDSIQTNHTTLKSSPTSPIIDVAEVQTQQKHDQRKRKRTKRKKSVQLRSLYKKKKSYEFSEKSEARYSQRVKKKSKIRLHSESSVTSDQIRHDSHTKINDKEHFSVTENSSPSANKELETTTKKLTLQSVPSAINEKLNTSGDKRKVDDTATEDYSEITKTKKLKFLDKSKEDMELKHDMHNLKEKVPLSLEKRTACYMPVAARRTRSKSVIVKSSTADFYDPYDIDLDDMIEKPDSFRRKINVLDKNTQNLKIHNHCKSKSNLQSSSKTHALVKKSSKPSDYFVNYRNKMAAPSKNNVTDSDDSTKSDVPLTKYIEDKEKKSSKPVSNKRNVKDSNLGRNGKQNVKSKRNNQNIKRNGRTLTTFNDIDKSSTPNDAEELRSEKFMESFGFFSQRKPRKSNLLASKKISETFHIIANESDDAYFGSKKRTQKRSNQNENKKSIGGGDTTTRPRRRIAAKKVIKRIPKIKKKVFVQPVPCFCRLCKKEFRRPDNFLRHQMTVLHASKLSEIELKMRTIPIIEKPNYLIAYKRQLDRLKLLTKKFANRKHSKYAKMKLPSLDKILAKVNRKVRQQKLAQRGLSRDEALFIDCCQLLKSNKSELKPPDPTSFNTGPNHLSESTVKTFDLLEKPIKGDGDVDSITAKNILESDEVKNLEKDLISGLKEAANEGALKTKIMYQRSVSDVGLNQIDDEKLDYSSSKEHESKYENVEPYPVSNPSKTKKQPEVKEKMYPDIIESIDMFEDKFDKIKRKCRSQAAAAAAKQTQAVIEPSARFKCRKKAEKKKGRRNSKKTHQSSQVLTKGALKGFDGIKVSIPTSDINMSAIVPSITSPKKKKKLNTRKKERVAESSSKNDSQRHAGDGMTSQKEVDVYEFLDNEDAVFEFRPSTLMERFKSISYKDTPGTSKQNPGVDDADNSRDTVSDGDDFVYMSDDYICSDNETENSLLSCELSNGKVGCELKKNLSPLKRKDAVEKNAVMGKIFKFNAVRSDKKSTKVKETAKPKANLDQLFDSLLEDEPNSSVLNNDAVSPKNDVFVTPKKHDHSSKYEKYSRTFSSRDECSSPTKSKSPSPKRHMSSPREYDRSSLIDYGPSTSKTAAIDFGPSTSKKRDSISPKDFKDLSPKKYVTPLHEVLPKYTTIKHSEPLHSKSDVIPIKKRDSKKETNKLDEGISTSYDYKADVYDQYDDTGVARQRARRKCTVGKQNVLAETWSSESEPDGIPPRPNSAESVVLTSARRKRGKKRDRHHGGARRTNNRHISFKKQDVESRLSNFSRTTARGGDATASRAGRDSDEAVSVNPYDAPAPSTSSAHLSLPPPGPRPRARPTAYYNWSSDGDDEPEHVQQHGWIVGDSHKKLVTMLAHAKGRKGKTDDKRHFVE